MVGPKFSLFSKIVSLIIFEHFVQFLCIFCIIYAYLHILAYFMHILSKYAYKCATLVALKSAILAPLLTGFLSKNMLKYHYCDTSLKSDICSKNR